MTSVYKCDECGKRLYFSGKEEEALDKYDAASYEILTLLGINVHSSWFVVQKGARCCENPDIYYSLNL